ncbi:MAG TPA: mechanosensitive ion channel family protein [Luteimonas sp.]|nr:mechanosensitive ion channel family protein [Luteimonas sp.]
MRYIPAAKRRAFTRFVAVLLVLSACTAWAQPSGSGRVSTAGSASPVAIAAATAIPNPQRDDTLTLDSDLHARFHTALVQVEIKLLQLVAAAPLLLVAVLIVLLATWLGGVLSRRTNWLRLRSRNPYMDGLVRRIVQTLMLLAGVLVALDLLGATSLVGAVLGSAGVVGLVLGFAFKDIAENYVSGILLSLRRPFSPGDHVMIDTREGKVVALDSRATTLMTLDGSQLRLPNAMVFKSVILNYSHNPKRRFEFAVTIDPAESIRQSQEIGLGEIAKVHGVLADPAPSSLVHEFTPAGIALRFFGWVDQHESDLGKARSEAIRLVKAAYARAGIDPPHTVYHIVTSRAASSRDDTPEPAHDEATQVDTSVNHDIDAQLQAERRARDDDNLLESGGARE